MGNQNRKSGIIVRLPQGFILFSIVLLAAMVGYRPHPVVGSTIPATPPPTTPAATATGTATPASPSTPGSTIPSTPMPSPTPTLTPTPAPELPPVPEFIPQALAERYNNPTIITTEPVWVPGENGGGEWVTEWEVTARSRVEALPGGWLAIEYADSWPTYTNYVGDNALGEPVFIDIPFSSGFDIGFKSTLLRGVADASQADTRIFVFPRDAAPLSATMELTHFPIDQARLANEQTIGVQYDWFDDSIIAVVMDPVQIGTFTGRAQTATIRSDGTIEGILDISVTAVRGDAMTAEARVTGEYRVAGISGIQYTQVVTDLGTLYLIASEDVENAAAEIRVLQDEAGDLFLEVLSLVGTKRLLVKLDKGGNTSPASRTLAVDEVDPAQLPKLTLFVLNESETILPVTGGLTPGVYYAAPPQALQTNRLQLPIVR